MIDDCRKAFDMWFAGKYGYPQDRETSPSWEAWQAAWASYEAAKLAAIPEPVEVSEEALERSIRDACTDSHPYGSNCTVSSRDARRISKYLLAGHRIVKGELA